MLITAIRGFIFYTNQYVGIWFRRRNKRQLGKKEKYVKEQSTKKRKNDATEQNFESPSDKYSEVKNSHKSRQKRSKGEENVDAINEQRDTENKPTYSKDKTKAETQGKKNVKQETKTSEKHNKASKETYSNQKAKKNTKEGKNKKSKNIEEVVEKNVDVDVESHKKAKCSKSKCSENARNVIDKSNKKKKDTEDTNEKLKKIEKQKPEEDSIEEEKDANKIADPQEEEITTVIEEDETEGNCPEQSNSECGSEHPTDETNERIQDIDSFYADVKYEDLCANIFY